MAEKQHALKARSQYKQHALKGQKLLAQGIALGFCGSQTWRPVRAKALKILTIYKASTLSGRAG